MQEHPIADFRPGCPQSIGAHKLPRVTGYQIDSRLLHATLSLCADALRFRLADGAPHVRSKPRDMPPVWQGIASPLSISVFGDDSAGVTNELKAGPRMEHPDCFECELTGRRTMNWSGKTHQTRMASNSNNKEPEVDVARRGTCRVGS